jgi:hypothetical protein
MNKKGKYQAVPYNKALLQFAFSQGLRFWTVEDRMKVVARYEIFAAIKN